MTLHNPHPVCHARCFPVTPPPPYSRVSPHYPPFPPQFPPVSPISPICPQFPLIPLISPPLPPPISRYFPLGTRASAATMLARR